MSAPQANVQVTLSLPTLRKGQPRNSQELWIAGPA